MEGHWTREADLGTSALRGSGCAGSRAQARWGLPMTSGRRVAPRGTGTNEHSSQLSYPEDSEEQEVGLLGPSHGGDEK